MPTMTSRDFNLHRSSLKQAVANGPVVVTDRGRPSIVVMSIEEYQRLSRTGPTVEEIYSAPDTLAVELDLTRSKQQARAADLG